MSLAELSVAAATAANERVAQRRCAAAAAGRKVRRRGGAVVVARDVVRVSHHRLVRRAVDLERGGVLLNRERRLPSSG